MSAPEETGDVAVLDGTKSRWWDPRPSVVVAPAPAAEIERALASRVERRIVHGRFDIPQVPSIAIEAMNLLARGDADIAAIADVIGRDQRLAADLLSFANSALFAGAAPATNLATALMRVGCRQARSVVLSACLKGAMYSGSEVARAERLWRHACAVAAAAARIGRNLGLNADDLYVGGLFHDVGKIVVLKIVDDVLLRSQTTPPRPGFVESLLDRLHEVVGAEIALNWGLPDEVVDAIQHHDERTRDRLTPSQAVVAVADHCCRRLGVGATDHDGDDDLPVAGLVALEAMGVPAENLDRVLDGVREAVEAMQARNV